MFKNIFPSEGRVWIYNKGKSNYMKYIYNLNTESSPKLC